MKSKYKNSEHGITLVEIIIALFLVVLFSAIVIAYFPRVQATFSLSRATYKFAQDLRRVQDLSLSGAQYIDPVSGSIISIAGYGIYIDISGSGNNKRYKIYADSCIDQAYTLPTGTPGDPCEYGDVVIEDIDINAEERGVYIKEFTNISGNTTSIDFRPPNPTTKIDNATGDVAEIIFGLDEYPDKTRAVLVNTAGLIEVK